MEPSSPVEGKSSTPSTPTTAPASVLSTPTLKDADTVSTESMHGSVASIPSLSYNVPQNANRNSESPHHSSSNTAMINSPGSSFPRPPVPGISSSSAPSFSYNIPQTEVAVSGGQSFHSRVVVASEVPKNVSVSPTSLQPPVSGQLAHPSSFIRGMPPPPPVAVPRDTSSNAANFSYNGHHQSVSSAPPVPHSTLGPTSTNFSPTFWMPSGPPFQQPPGRAASALPPPPNTTVASSQQPIYGPYASNPPQGVWIQPAPIGGLSRPAILPYPPPAAFPGSFSLPAQRMPPPSDAQPPGSSTGVPGIVSDSMPSVGSVMPLELPPGTDNSKHVNAVGAEQLDAWSAHRTETGILYYYNSVTGQSTYQKPPGFKGEPERVYAQPTPISWEKCVGTDWSLVTTNDGKRYYYNAKTKLSSWQIPMDVAEQRKKQESDVLNLKEQSMSVPNTSLTEKGSGPLSLSAPAIHTGGRDAISGVPVTSSSALDLIKKKLQDPTAPATSVTPPGGEKSSELNGGDQVGSENGKDKVKDENADGNLSDTSSDSEDVDSGPTKEERALQFKEMLKERGVAPFSKWEKELPKFVFDPRFKLIPSYSARRAIFDHFVRTRAEEERKEKRAAQKAAIEGYRRLLDEAKEDINHHTDYQTFKRKWGHDPRFEALERKDREALLNERVIPLRRSVEEEARAKRAASVSTFKSMLKDNKDISSNSRWYKVKDILRNDPRYKSVRHEDREAIFNEYISELKVCEDEAESIAKAKRDEEEKLRERERALRKRKEREEQEVERVRSKARRKEAIESYQALLVETIKDPQVSWTDAKVKLEKDPQGRAANSYLDQSDLEKLFREHVKSLHDRCAHEFKALLSEVITSEASTKEYEDGKTVLTSWSTAKELLKDDTRYNKMPRKDRESLWRRHVEDLLRRRRKSTVDQQDASEKHGDDRTTAVDSRKYVSASRRNYDPRR
ncbi:pre-mRNA-processing protein 40C [Lactuca sativa]|uniref:Pre-mRNA-processing protein 40C n=1 Tax=Lactuca sativa TaxID=4236 RepID=A0A9R1W3C5_LACSA|nr:pre-mRNA-processing protein 40C [Lactuca sativa]KAJ0217640.1 hypothetical protein LSAT_V11C300114780 [Lactuca sativa]